MKALAGTLRAKGAIPNEPTPPVGVPDPALQHLSKTASELWPTFSAILLDMGVLTVADGPALAAMVESFADLINSRKILDEAGSSLYETYTRGGDVIIKQHPAVTMRNDADRRFCMWASHFGLTPAARSKVSAQISEKSNSFSEI
jgi:P27 family predicted phage terminase small subunit